MGQTVMAESSEKLDHVHHYQDDNLCFKKDVVFYYTSKSNIKKIISSQKLIPSINETDDCFYGIYFTTLCPCNSKRDILVNSYSETMRNEQKEYAFVKIDIDKLPGITQIDCEHNVWIYPTTNPLDLGHVHGAASCPNCFGNCSLCDGHPLKLCPRCDATGIFQKYKKCQDCNGSGYIKKCEKCKGFGNSQCSQCDGCGHFHFCSHQSYDHKSCDTPPSPDEFIEHSSDALWCYHMFWNGYDDTEYIKCALTENNYPINAEMLFCGNCALKLYLSSNKAIGLLSKSREYDRYCYQLLIHPEILKTLTKNENLFKFVFSQIMLRVEFYLDIKHKDIIITKEWIDLLNAFIVCCKKKSFFEYLLKKDNGLFFQKYVIDPIYIDSEICQLFTIFSMVCATKIRQKIPEIKAFMSISQWALKAQLLRIYNISVRCNNEKCGKRYFQHKFGMTFEKCYDYLSKNGLVVQHHNGWKSFQTLKWYKCKGCKMVFYCSRQCQKYDWNVFNHRNICRNFWIQ